MQRLNQAVVTIPALGFEAGGRQGRSSKLEGGVAGDLELPIRDKRGRLTSLRSLSATANSSAVSCRLVLCSLSHLDLSQSCKLMLIPNQENLRPGHNARRARVRSPENRKYICGPLG